MAIDLNTDPYFDDYSEDKKFYRILFKPGYAVQARELNQLQTILQKQISRFGDHVFKNGSLVIPGNTFYDRNFNYVKLTTSLNSVPTASVIEELIGRQVTGQTSGVKGEIQTTIAAENSDLPTLYVKYISAGNSASNVVFDANEILTTSDSGTSISVQVDAAAATGKAHAVKIDRGVYYIKDNFVLVTPQTLILDKYGATPTFKVGLAVSETLTTSDDDSTLLDPALGSANYFAPGADRLEIELTLQKRSVTSITDSDNFIELLRVENGVLVSLVDKPGYNLLQDEFARRTYDESGDYTVTPFGLSYIEHLKDDEHLDGYLTAANGGIESKGIAVLRPGKSYVRGYEVSTIFNKYLIFNKPRDNTLVTNAVIRTPFGNYTLTSNLYTIPNFTSNYTTVGLYDRYKESHGVPSGTLVGNAKVVGFEVNSGNVYSKTSTFKNYIFDVSMIKGYTFERDAKSFFTSNISDSGYSSPIFTADLVPAAKTLTGTVSVINNSNLITGVNTLYTTELKVGDYVTFSTTTVSYRVESISNTTTLTLASLYSGIDTSGVTFTRNESYLNDVTNHTLVFEFPQKVIKSISDITYRTRRVIPSTLTAGNTTITLTATGETFASHSDGRFFAVITSGVHTGNIYAIDANKYTNPTPGNFATVNFKLYDYGLSTQDVLLFATINKSNPTVKTKTRTYTTTDYTAETDARATVISLGKADVYELSNVKMSANAFGTPYYSVSETDITSRYTLDTNQTTTYYGVSKIKLKPGFPEPTGPIRIGFKYHTHSTGDYFSANSYPDYEDISTFVNQGRTYQLRDCLDFRSRIGDTGVSFTTATGGVISDFLDLSSDFICDFDYYLPRSDKIYVSSKGEFTYKEGVSSLDPVEPATPNDSMALYIIEHPAYGFDILKDSTFKPVDQKRYTMQDIGKLDTRITNLEYYTTLTLLELDTAVFTVKDTFGLDRFKNGFIVDAFKGHGVGDIRNSDYKIAMDFSTGELRPSYSTRNSQFEEISSTDAARTSNGYAKVGTTAVLNYTHSSLVENPFASTTESVNPFDTYTFVGTMSLNPPGDVFFELTSKPLVFKNDDGQYDSLIPDAVGEKIYGTVWNSWKKFWYESEGKQLTSQIPYGYIITDQSNESERSTAILPFVRAVTINFEAKRLKPRTKYYAFFGGYDVTTSCHMTGKATLESNAYISFSKDDFVSPGNLFSDEAGAITGVFKYTPSDTFKIPAGLVKFRLTDSPTNSENKESLAEAVFVVDGSIKKETPSTDNYTAPAGTNLVGTPSTSTPAATAYAPGLSDYIVAVAAGVAVGTAEGITLTNFLKENILKNVNDAAAIAYNPSTFSGYDGIQAPSAVTIEGTDFRGNPVSINIPAYRDGTTGDKSFNFIGDPDGTAGSALNVLTATNVPGDLFVQVVKDNIVASSPTAAAGEAAWTHVVSVYDGVRDAITAVTNEVNRAAAEGSAPAVSYTADQINFYAAGVATGQWTDSPSGIAAATNAYAAATTLGYVEAGGGGYGASGAGAVAAATDTFTNGW